MALIRTIPAALAAALTAPAFYPVILVHLDWPEDPVFCHSGTGPISYQGETWVGVGGFGSISVPQEATGLAATNATMRLTGVPPEIFDRLEDPIRNRAARVLFGCVTARAGNVLVSDPVEVFAGYMDALQYTGRKEGDQITHGVELRVATGPSARASASVYHSHEDQIAAYPGDTLFRHLINNEAEANMISWPQT